MSKIEVNTVAPQCGTTLTLGESGDTVTLGSGASQSGFGRTGTVDWDTTAKTASFTAVSGNGYFVNTTSGAVTVTLPATPSGGDIVAVSDYAQTSNTNNITVARNGSNIQGDAEDLVISNNGAALTFVYVDATKGWIVVNSGNESDKQPTPEFVTATGGTVTCCGDYKIHTFTSPGTFTVSNAGNVLGSATVDYLVVAGGGGSATLVEAVAGGGAGGFRESSGAASGCYTASPLGSGVSALPVSVSGYPITVGAGGAGGGPTACVPGNCGSNGSNSVFSTITSTGGGGGGGFRVPGNNGGSGGGGGARASATGGAGNTPPVSPPQGTGGGTANTPDLGPDDSSGGGGGAISAGANGTPSGGGAGGNGATTSISGSSTTYAGGGGGGAQNYPPGAAGPGGGGIGGSGSTGTAGTAGTANTGGGAGGRTCGPGSNGQPGLAGGSGIVIIRYKYQ